MSESTKKKRRIEDAFPDPLYLKKPKDWKTYHEISDDMYLHKECATDGCKRTRLNKSRYCYLHSGVKKPKRCYIYFILAIGLERVKIGYTRDLRQRFSSIQADCPVEIALGARFMALPEVEAALHALLGKHRVRGEWFTLHDEVMDIMEIAEGKGWDGIKDVLDGAGLYHPGLG